MQGVGLREQVIDARPLRFRDALQPAALLLGPTFALGFFQFGLALDSPPMGVECAVAHGLLAEDDDRRRDLAQSALEGLSLLVLPRGPEFLSQVWGYASNEARHIQEGRDPQRGEAELLVGLAAVMATYLTNKK